jgi:hypothetical protein
MQRIWFTLMLVMWLSPPLSATPQEAKAFDATYRLTWPDNVADIARANRTAQDEVSRFINSFRGHAVEPPLALQEFRFAPIERGKIGLMATVDASGRDLFYAVMVVVPEGARFRRTMLPSAPPHFLPAELIDLDGDGVDEVITKEPVGGYQGARTEPIFWYSIFAIHGGLPKDVSARFPEFYNRMVLPGLDYLDRLFALVRERPPNTLRLQRAQVDFVRLKVRRKILGEKRVGLHEAINWAESGDTRLQELAISMFEEIPGQQSLKQLQELARSKDPVVSRRAQIALARLGEQRR